MEVTIKKFVEEKTNLLNDAKKEIELSTLELKKLIEEPKVQEYFKTREELKEKKEKLLEVEKEFDEKVQEHCNHPMWNLIYKNEIYDYHNNKKELECVLCKKHIKTSSCDMNDLYENKKLIAFRKLERDYYEGRSWYEYLPIASTEEVEKYYYDLYVELEQFSIVSKHINIEETLWEHFCENKKQKVLIKI